MADDILAELREGGVLEREGSFEVDAAKAREKMAQFQLVDPHLYVLEFVQAAHLLGASLITLDQDADELEIKFDGQTLEASHLHELWTMALSRHREPRLRALRHLAIGINASAGLKPARLILESGADGQAVRLLAQPGRGEQVEQISWPSGASGTRIYVKEAWRPGHLVEFWRGRQGLLEESQHVRERCLRSDVHIEVGGARVSVGKALPAGVKQQLDFRFGHDYGRVWLTTNPEDQRVYLLQHGVEVALADHPLPGLPLGWGAMIEGARLTKDLSQADFVRDAAWRELMEQALVDALCALLMRWLPPASDSLTAHAVISHLILWMIDHYVPVQPEHRLELSAQRLGKSVVESEDALGARYNALWLELCKREVWECDVDGESVWLSSSQIRGKMEPGRLEWVRPTMLGARPKRKLVARLDKERAEQLARTMRASAVDVADVYEAERERELLVQRWRGQPVQEGMPEGMCFEACRVKTPAGEGAVGFRREAGHAATLILRCQGKLVCVEERRIEDDLAGLVVMIDSAGELDASGAGLEWSEGLGLLWAECCLRIAPAYNLALRALFIDKQEISEARQRELLDAGRVLILDEVRVHAGRFWIGFTRAPETPPAVRQLLYGKQALSERLGELASAHSAALFNERLGALGLLARVPVLGSDEEADGEPRWSLEDVGLALNAHGKLAVLKKEELKAAARLSTGRARLVVCARDGAQQRILGRLVVGSLQLAWLAELERDAARQQFMMRPKLKLELPRAPSWQLDKGPGWLTRAQINTPQLEGELGLGASGERAGLICHVLYEEREVEALRVDLAWGCFEAVVMIRDATPNAAFDAMELPAAYDRDALRDELVGTAHAMIGAWLKELDRDALARDEMVREMMWRLALAQREDAALGAVSRVREGLDRLPCFELVSGSPLTLTLLDKRLSKLMGPLHYVVGEVGVMAELVRGDAQLVVRLPSSRFEPLLARAAGPGRALRDVSDSEARRLSLVQRKHAFFMRQQEPLMIPGALRRAEVQEGPIKGQVALMPDPDRRGKGGVASVELLYDRRLVTTQSEVLPLGRFQARLDVPTLKLDAEWSGVAPGHDLRPLRALALERCWALLIEACDDAERADSALRSQLGWYLVRAVGSNDPLGKRGRDIYDALIAMRLFERVEARPASYDMLKTLGSPIRYVQAEAIKRLGARAQGALVARTWDDQEIIRALFPEAEDVGLGPALKLGAPSAQDPKAHELVAELLSEAPAPSDATKQLKIEVQSKTLHEGAPGPAPQAQEHRLITRLRAQLLAARGDERVLLGDGWLDQLVSVARGADQPLCELPGRQVVINLDHPVCQLAQEREDAATLALVTAAVYAAINRREEIITDEHERTYLARLARLATVD